jgi:hypothetical protein
VRRGVRDELNKVENGGPGAPDEKVIRAPPRYVPPEMDKSVRPAPALPPAPPPPEPSKEPAPARQAPPAGTDEKPPPDR